MNTFDRPKTPYSINLVSSMRMNAGKFVDQPVIVRRAFRHLERDVASDQPTGASFVRARPEKNLGLLLNNYFE